MYEYLINYSYWQDGRRIKEHDTFCASSDQEAVDNCRAYNEDLFANKFGRIESVHRIECRYWEERNNWE